MISSTQILAPTEDSAATSDTFDVGKTSRVVFIAPSTGEDITDDDSFELCLVIDESPIRSVRQFDKDGAILLGASMTQFEVMLRGTYLVKKILSTSEPIGVYQRYGLERGNG